MKSSNPEPKKKKVEGFFCHREIEGQPVNQSTLGQRSKAQHNTTQHSTWQQQQQQQRKKGYTSRFLSSSAPTVVVLPSSCRQQSMRGEMDPFAGLHELLQSPIFPILAECAATTSLENHRSRPQARVRLCVLSCPRRPVLTVPVHGCMCLCV